MRQRLYDWDKLFARKRFEMKFPDDYDCSQASIVQQIRNAAAVRDVGETKIVHVKCLGNVVEVVMEDRQLCQKL